MTVGQYVWISYRSVLIKFEPYTNTTVKDVLLFLQSQYPELMERPSIEHYHAYRIEGERKIKFEAEEKIGDLRFSIANPLFIESGKLIKVMKVIMPRVQGPSTFLFEKAVDDYLQSKLSEQAIEDIRNNRKQSLIRCKIVFAQHWRFIMQGQGVQSLASTCKEIMSVIELKLSEKISSLKRQECLKFELNDILTLNKLLEKFVWNQRRISDDVQGIKTKELNGLYMAFYKSLIHERFPSYLTIRYMANANGSWQLSNVWADQIDNLIAINFGANVIRDERRKGIAFMYPDVFVSSIKKIGESPALHLSIISRPLKSLQIYTAYRDIDNCEEADLFRLANIMRDELVYRHSISTRVDECILAYTFGALIQGPQITFYGMSKLAGNYSLLFELACFNLQSPNDRVELPYWILSLSNVLFEEGESMIESIRKQPFSLSDE